MAYLNTLRVAILLKFVLVICILELSNATIKKSCEVVGAVWHRGIGFWPAPARTRTERKTETFHLVTIGNTPTVIPWIPFMHRWWVQSCTRPKRQIGWLNTFTALLPVCRHGCKDWSTHRCGCAERGYERSEPVEGCVTGYSEVCKWDEWCPAARFLRAKLCLAFTPLAFQSCHYTSHAAIATSNLYTLLPSLQRGLCTA